MKLKRFARGAASVLGWLVMGGTAQATWLDYCASDASGSGNYAPPLICAETHVNGEGHLPGQ